MLLLLLLFFFLNGLCSIVSAQLSEIYADSYSTIPVSWESQADSNDSLVQQPTLDFINDTAATMVWVLTTDGSPEGIPDFYEIEYVESAYSEEYQLFERREVEIPFGFHNNSFTTTYTAAGLQPLSVYKFRTCPLYASHRGHCSLPLILTTLAASINYWEPVMARRWSMATSARGFNYPVVQRPHLDVGVEIYDEHTTENPIRFSDATTDQTPVLPSGRRGHSLSLVEGLVYMFGGRTNGYSCANVYKDTIDLGNAESGRDVYPCVKKQGEVDELWSFDISSYQWVFINTTKWQEQQAARIYDDVISEEVYASPPPREQHSAAVVDKDVYIYGGKSRMFDVASNGEVLFTHHSDEVYGDLWKLSVERPRNFILKYTNASGLVTDLNTNNAANSTSIPQTAQLFAEIDGFLNDTIADESDGVTPRNGLCVDKLKVRVRLRHPCLKQLKASLLGPGPRSGSPNYFPSSAQHEVLLFSKLDTANGTGCVDGVQYFEFDDDSLTLPEQCCRSRFNGTFRPMGRLAEFSGTTMSATWTLVIQDLTNDAVQGELLDWEIEFTASPCFRSFYWSNLTNDSADEVTPPKRYAANAIAYQRSIFIYGGRDVNDFPLHDLYRYDIDSATWTALTPVSFGIAWNPAESAGGNFAMTSWGLIRYGGYYRQPSLPEAYNNYDSSVAVQDPVTLRWRGVDVQPWQHYDAPFGQRIPAKRYLAASILIPSHHLTWKTKFTHRALYDQSLPSTHSNFQGSIADSLLVIGGFDGATGSVYDGSSGGYLSDIWMLRLSSWSTPGNRFQQQEYMDTHCRWRTTRTAIAGSNSSMAQPTGGTHSCLGDSGSKCRLRDLMMLAWCTRNNQSVI